MAFKFPEFRKIPYIYDVLASRAQRRLNREYQPGMSLVEMLMAVGIMAILLGFAVPQFRAMVIDTKISISVNQFVVANAYAREQAIRRGQLVTICRAVKADLGSDVCSDSATAQRAATDWGSGWLVFVEDASNPAGIGQIDGDEEILARQGELAESTQGSASLTRLTYNSNGLPVNMAGANLKFHYQQQFRRVLCIARSGRLRVLRDVDRCI